jgi:GNAT superfamily N-acetyltransferase
LTEADRPEVLAFLSLRPVHTVVMTSFINDNGVESELNRGEFYGYRNVDGKLEGVVLIGHTTLVEARTDDAMHALAVVARYSKARIHLIMSDGDSAEAFWSYYSDNYAEPRLTCVEELFELAFPVMVRRCDFDLRLATLDELEQVATAQAEVALMESGVDPMHRDRDGFLRRVARRIEQNRVYVVMDGDRLLFKADVVAQTQETAYLEGVYVDVDSRGQGIGPKCLAEVAKRLLDEVSHICLLSNTEMKGAHRSFQRAGFRNTDRCTTLFV